MRTFVYTCLHRLALPHFFCFLYIILLRLSFLFDNPVLPRFLFAPLFDAEYHLQILQSCDMRDRVYACLRYRWRIKKKKSNSASHMHILLILCRCSSSLLVLVYTMSIKNILWYMCVFLCVHTDYDDEVTSTVQGFCKLEAEPCALWRGQVFLFLSSGSFSLPISIRQHTKTHIHIWYIYILI